jgi:carbamoyl-phosphate synthase large subunit
MVRVLLGGAGGAASLGFARSLRASGKPYHLIGMNTSAADLLLADVDEHHLVPAATSPDYPDALFQLLQRTHPDFVHVQPDPEVFRLSLLRHVVRGSGAAYLLPDHDAIVTCQDKWLSYERWRAAELPLPETRLLGGADDLALAFDELGDELWLREIRGAGGAGSLRTRDRDLARSWIGSRDGWGRFTAAECLTARSVTWQSIWYEGELVVAQTRRRLRWAYGANAPTGVSGITGIGETTSDARVDEVAERAVRAVTAKPHGIFGVDLTYDLSGEPCPTEINVGRFFTTHEFFTRAGLNMPDIYVTVALRGQWPSLDRKVNPLPDGLIWVRSMDVEPVLSTVEELERLGVSASP